MPNDNYANEPNQSRSEDIIQSILDNTEYNEEARSRIEYLLIELKNAIEGGGGGGSVTSYAPLTEKPKIDNCTLQAGNNTSSDLGLQTKLTFDSTPTEDSTNPVTSGGVYTALTGKADASDVYDKSAIDTALNNKADKSTTYTKTEVDTSLSSKQNTISDLAAIRSGAAAGATAVQPISGKGLSTNDYTTAEKTKLAGIAEGAEVNVQSNWTQTTTTADDYIKNKPTLGTAAALDVAASGNASTSQVVKGNDTRLTDARNAADVSSWAKAVNKPSYNGSEIALTGYTEAQSKSNVSATDTTNAAIGKLEYRVETNENNILSNTLNGGGINKFQVTAATTTINGITFTVNADKTVTATGSIADNTQNAIFVLGAYTAVSGDVLSEGFAEVNSKAYIYAHGGSTSLANATYKKILANDIGVERNYACVITSTTVGQVNITFKPMICNSNSYAKSGVYQPYAMSNAELTAKEQVNENNISKDEAALVEIVDSGAKNFLQNNATSQTISGVTFTVNADKSITLSGTATSNITSFFISREVPALTGNMFLSGCPEGGSTHTYRLDILDGSPNGSVLFEDFGEGRDVDWSLITTGIYTARIRIGSGTTVDGLIFKPMLCTKPAWDISHQYVPYRPSYQKLYEMVKALQTN